MQRLHPTSKNLLPMQKLWILQFYNLLEVNRLTQKLNYLHKNLKHYVECIYLNICNYFLLRS